MEHGSETKVFRGLTEKEPEYPCPEPQKTTKTREEPKVTEFVETVMPKTVQNETTGARPKRNTTWTTVVTEKADAPVIEPRLTAGGNVVEEAPVAPTSTPVVPTATVRIAEAVPAADVTRSVNTTATTRAARLEVATYVQEIAEDMTRQRARDHPESFVGEIESLVPKKKKTLYHHPTLAKQHVTRLAETYPGITFQATEEAFVSNDHEVAAIARRAATHVIYHTRRWKPTAKWRCSTGRTLVVMRS